MKDSKKFCFRCKEIKDVTEFYKDNRRKDGLMWCCKSCKKEQNDKQVEYRKARLRKLGLVKGIRCSNKKDKLHKEQKGNSNKVNKYYKEVIVEYGNGLKEKTLVSTEYRKQKSREYSKQYRQTHKEQIYQYNRNRKKKLKGTITKDKYKECYDFFGGCCAYSGKKLDYPCGFDHVVPVASGGTNDIKNIVPCSLELNQSKSNKNFFKWYKTSGYYDENRLLKILDWIY